MAKKQRGKAPKGPERTPAAAVPIGELVEVLRRENAWLRERVVEAERERAELRRLVALAPIDGTALPAPSEDAPRRPVRRRRPGLLAQLRERLRL